MSIMRCPKCDRDIDTDFNSEHFDECNLSEAKEAEENMPFIEYAWLEDKDIVEWFKEYYDIIRESLIKAGKND